MYEGQIYTEASAHMDLIAQRLVSRGVQAIRTIKAVSQVTALPAYPELARAEQDHIEAFARSLAAFSENTRAAILEAEEADNPVTADMFTGITGAVDKSHWLVTAYQG